MTSSKQARILPRSNLCNAILAVIYDLYMRSLVQNKYSTHNTLRTQLTSTYNNYNNLKVAKTVSITRKVQYCQVHLVYQSMGKSSTGLLTAARAADKTGLDLADKFKIRSQKSKQSPTRVVHVQSIPEGLCLLSTVCRAGEPASGSLSASIATNSTSVTAWVILNTLSANIVALS